MLRRRKLIGREVEKKILTGIIMSDRVISSVLPFLTPTTFELEIVRKVSKWIIEYYKIYQKSPKDQIKDLYYQHSSELEESDAEEIFSFLTQISEDYSETGINEDYIRDQALIYCKKKYLINMSDEVKALAEAGQLDEAEQIFKTKTLMAQKSTFEWIRPIDDSSFINRVFDYIEDDFFHLPGELGKLVGPLRRGWLIGILGPRKRGKSFWTQNILIEGIFQKKRVALISLEMTSEQMGKRNYSQLTSTGEEGTIRYPILDCTKNQNNSCVKRLRINKIKKPIVYDPSSPYKSCTLCKDTKLGQFSPAVWYVMEERPLLTRKRTINKMKKFRSTFGNNRFQLLAAPAYSMNMKDVDTSLDYLETNEGFIPDLIFVDYADILRPEHGGERRDQIDTTWKLLKRLAVERHALVVTGSQSNRGSEKKSMLEESDTSDDIRKVAHVDVLLTLNQTPEEKENDIMRVGVIAHRHKKFNPNIQIMALQQLDVGQPSLELERVYWDSNKDKEDKNGT